MQLGSSWLRNRWVVNVIGMLLLMVVSGNMSVFMGQDANWDFKNYHWYNAYSFLENRLAFDIAPAQLQTFHNPLLDLPYYWVATRLPDHPAYAGFLQGTYFGVMVFALIKCVLVLFPANHLEESSRINWSDDGQVLGLNIRVHARPTFIAVAVVVGVTGSASLSQLGSTMNEVQVAALILSGLYLLLLSLQHPRPVKLLILAGFLVGSAAGLKLTAAPYVVGAISSFGAICFYRRGLGRQFLTLVAAAAAGFLAFDGWWMLYLSRELGSPLFPYFNHFFRSEWWDLVPLQTSRFFPRNLGQRLLYPFYWIWSNHYLVMDAAFRDVRMAIGCVATCAISIGLVRKRAATPSTVRQQWMLLLIFCVVSYVVWLSVFSIYRYLVPLETLSGLLLVGAFRWIGVRKNGLLLLLLASTTVILWTRYPEWGHVSYSRGVVSLEDRPHIEEGALVLLVGGDPMAYVATSFPHSSRFVGLGNNLLKPGQSNRLQHKVDEAITHHKGAIYVIQGPTSDDTFAASLLSGYGLMRTVCQVLLTSLDNSTLKFCDTKRIQNEQTAIPKE